MRWLERPAFLLILAVGLGSAASAASGAEPRSTAGATASNPSAPRPVAGTAQIPVERGSAPLPARLEHPATAFPNAFHQPDEGLYTGGQPSAAQLQQAASAGIATVIDLRQPDEDRGFDEATTAADLGLNYVRIPVAGAAGLTAANAQALQAALTRSNGPVLLHCASGNRVGALLALVKHQQGASTEDALQFGRNAGMTSLETQTRALLEQDAAR